MSREPKSSRSKSRSLKAAMIKKNSKRDWLNFKEALELSRLEEPVKFKLAKSKTESLMPFAPPELPSLRE